MSSKRVIRTCQRGIHAALLLALLALASHSSAQRDPLVQGVHAIVIIVSDMEKAYAQLRQAKVQHASSGPQRLPDWNKNAAGISAFYFKDPDEHPVEVLQFPPDKGAEKWHRQNGKLFLGIDHTAIVVW